MSKRVPITSPYTPDIGEVRAWLEKMIASMKLVELVVAIVALVTRMRDINAELIKQVATMRRRRPRSETLKRLERQLALAFDGVVRAPAAPATETNETEDEPKKSRRGRHPGRAALPAHLPRVPVPNPVPPEMRICPMCGSEMTTVGHSTCEYLDIIPARLVVMQRMDETVACPHDDTIVSAPTPPQIVERGKLGTTLIVEAMADKFIEHSPIERQSTRLLRSGVYVAPQTLGHSVLCAIDLLAPVARMIHEQTRGPGMLGMDSTSIPILDRMAQEGIRNGAITCWTNAHWVSFVYSPSADSESVKNFLRKENFKRAVQCDGTSITSFIERAGGTRPGCWSHGRSKLVLAARSGDLDALEGVRIIAELFAIEKASKLAGENAEQRTARRRQGIPVLVRLRAWVDEHRAVIPPKTPFAQALGYLHRQWKRLILFLDDGNIELTNNRRERELRTLVLGRKNWLFTWGDIGGERTAHILTIIASCIAHEVEPRAYLHRVVKLILAGWPNAKLRDLLPDRIVREHPELEMHPVDPPDG
jgi:transposase